MDSGAFAKFLNIEQYHIRLRKFIEIRITKMTYFLILQSSSGKTVGANSTVSRESPLQRQVYLWSLGELNMGAIRCTLYFSPRMATCLKVRSSGQESKQVSP